MTQFLKSKLDLLIIFFKIYKGQLKLRYCVLFCLIAVYPSSIYAMEEQVATTNVFSSENNSQVTQVTNVDTSKENKNSKEDLDEVVVVGYGSQKKKNISGAISKVQAKDLENRVLTRLEDAIKGSVAGAMISSNSGQPGSPSTVAIRGLTSINSFEPLYVVDGVPVAGGIDYINSSDIESIEVLKDAASAAIYGTKGAAGVILVTTKSGKSGILKVNYNSYFGLQAPDNKLALLNASQYAVLQNELAVNSGKDIIFKNPQLLGKGTDWQDQIFNHQAQIQTHELSIQGGTQNSNYFVSFGYYKQEGIISTSISNYERFTTRFNSSHKIKSWLSFGNNVSYAYMNSKGINENGYFGGPLASAINLDPITPTIQKDPIELALPTYTNNKDKIVKDADGNLYAVSQYVSQEMTNPLAFEKINQGNFSFTHKIVGNVFVEIEPIKGLKIKSNLGVDLAFFGRENFTPIYYLNASTQTGQTSFLKELTQSLGYVFTNTIGYTKNIQEHDLSFLGGIESRLVPSNKVLGVSYNGLVGITNFDQASMNYSLPASQRQGWGSEQQIYKMFSFFGRFNYGYKDKYLITGVLRQDGSSHFGANNRYGFFPAFSVAWVPTNESLWTDLTNNLTQNIFNNIKIRASYGVNGNDNLDAFQYVSTIVAASGNSFGSGGLFTTGAVPAAPANADLKWEQTTQYNVGLDLTIFKRFKMVVDYFIKNTTDMLMTPQIPLYIGAFSNPWSNVASLSNKGWELEISYNQKIKEVAFEVKVNGSYIKNEVTNIGSFAFIENAYFQSAAYPISRTVVGQPISQFYGFKTNGIFQNNAEVQAYKSVSGQMLQPNAKPGDFKWTDVNGDGKISDSDRTFLGSPIPTFMFGFNVSANYKGIDIMINAQGVYGNKIFQQHRRLDIASSNYTAKYWNRWTGEGTSNSVPKLTNNDNSNNNFTNPSDFYIEDGAFLRIRTIQIGYTFPQKWLSKIQVEKFRLYFSVNNPYTFTNYNGLNPEIGGFSYSNGYNKDAFGIDRGVYPVSRAFLVGCNFIF